MRELTAASEEGQKWSERMAELLTRTNTQTTEAGGKLPEEDQRRVRKKYRRILADAEKENPLSVQRGKPKRGRIAQTKTRNLIDRMCNHEDDILRFMANTDVPFTNNPG